MRSDQGFRIEIFTPAGLALDDTASEAKLPSANGEIGILPQHIKYTGLIGTGVLHYNSLDAGEAIALVISGGFCSFANDTLTILADSVDTMESVDRESYASEREKYVEVIKEGNTFSPEWEQAKESLARIEAIDTLISH